MRYLARPNERSYDRFMNQCLVDPDRVEGELTDRWNALRAYSIDRSRAPRVKNAMGMMMKKIGVPAIAKTDLHRIAVPTTLIWGRQDRALPVKIARAASARFGWGLHVIDDCADDPPMEQPEALVDAINAATEAAGHLRG